MPGVDEFAPGLLYVRQSSRTTAALRLVLPVLAIMIAVSCARSETGPRSVVTDSAKTPQPPPPPPPPPPPAPAPVTMIVAGNLARCGEPHTDSTAQLLDNLPGTVFTAGDNAFPDGSAENFHDCYAPTWGRALERTWAVMGNHDYETGTADAAFDYFGPHAGPRGLGYYSLDLGSWHIIVLNDNIAFSAGSEQELWLKSDLAANEKLCTLALWHQPYFLSSATPGFVVRQNRKILWDDLYAAGADVVINGHQHHYERMTPMNPSGQTDVVAGIRQFNVGTGGESVAMPTVIHPSSEVQSTTYGVLTLTLRESAYDWRFAPIAGQSFADSGSAACH